MTFSKKNPPPDAVFLTDNGSLRPEATRTLRQVAAKLSTRLGQQVEPVSVLHSHKIDPAHLGGHPATIFEEHIPRLLAQGQRHFLVLPFFFGPSRALTEYLPQCFRTFSTQYPGATLTIAPPLAGETSPPDPRLAQALATRVRAIDAQLPRADSPVVLVDHGSPLLAVARIRDQIGQQLQQVLGPRRPVAVSSMERRPGPDYAFNEPLLENILRQPPFNTGEVIVAQLFLLQGRHAGENGDIATICQQASLENPTLHCHRTDLLGHHPLILDILTDRTQQRLITP